MKGAARSVLLFVVAAAALAPAVAATARVRAVPATGTVRAGSTVTVDIRISRSHDVGSVPFTLHYDPAILEFLPASPVEGGFLRRNGAATSFLATAPSGTRSGTIVVGLSRLGQTAGAGGKGTLCRLTFRARAPGIAAVRFGRGAVLDPSARPMAAVFTGATLTVKGVR